MGAGVEGREILKLSEQALLHVYILNVFLFPRATIYMVALETKTRSRMTTVVSV